MSNATATVPTPHIVELPERQAAVIRIEGTTADLPALIGEAFELTSKAIEASGATFAGEPFARYHAFGARISAEAGFPFDGTLQQTDRVYATSLPGGRAVTTTHVGPYHNLDVAWERGQAWIREQGLAQSGTPWECYLTDPAEPGPPVTEIYWPIR
jgi:effector-binding domain-containing protein